MLDRIKNIGAISVGLLIALLILEGFLRVYNPFPFRIRSNKIILPVNQETIKVNEKDTIVVRNNSLGFRGANPPADLDNYLSIVTVGGSTTICINLTEEDTWSEQLKIRLQDEYDSIWLNNAGLPGHSTFGHQILLEDYIVQLKPKYVLLLVGINDIGRKSLHDFDQSIFRTHSKNPIMRVLEKSEIFYTLKSIARVRMAKKFKLLHTDYDLQSLQYATNTEQEILRLVKHHAKNYLGNYRKRIESLIRQCEDNGIQPILITQPMLYGNTIDPKTGINLGELKIFGAGRDNERLESFMINNENMDISSLAYWDLLQSYNQVTTEVGKGENILVIDLASEMPKDSRHYLDPIHFSKEGATKVSEIIFSHLDHYLKQ